MPTPHLTRSRDAVSRTSNGWSRRDAIGRGSAAFLVLALPSAACAQTTAQIDLFTEIADQEVPTSARAIATRGWSRAGVGAALYVYDPRVDQKWARRRPRSAVLLADGRGFRLDKTGGDVRRYGAQGDGKTDDTAAINEALADGGTVVLAGPATYVATDRLLVSVPQTRVMIDEAVTLKTRAWRYQGSQTPFGNAIHVTGDDCEILGAGETSIVQNLGSDANGIGFLHCGGGRVARLVLQGGKDAVRAIGDDTFQSGVSIVNDRDSHAAGRPSRVTIEQCMIVDWTQYGINVYGDLAAGISIRGNTISRCGKQGDPLSVGAGIALTRGVGPILVDENSITDNKAFGVFISSAGVEIHDITLSRNQISRNGQEGIRCTEERHFGSTGDIGQQRILITMNHIDANREAGIRVGTYDNVGTVQQMQIADNRIADNRRGGILLQANAVANRGVAVSVVNNEILDNGGYGLTVGLNRIALSHDGNRFERNRRGSTIDYRGPAPRPLDER